MPTSPQPLTQPSPKQVNNNNWLLAAAVTAFVGFADSAYLTADHYFALPLPCSVTHGCETVLTSPYAMVGPIPLALFGVGFYLLTLFLCAYLLTSLSVLRAASRALVGLASIGFLMSIVFESIQFFLIHAWCLYCALSALCTLLLFAFSLRWYLQDTAH